MARKKVSRGEVSGLFFQRGWWGLWVSYCVELQRWGKSVYTLYMTESITGKGKRRPHFYPLRRMAARREFGIISSW